MMCRSSLPIAIAFAWCATGLCNPPELTHSSPLAVAPGRTTELVFHGRHLQGATGVWTRFKADRDDLWRPTTVDTEDACTVSLQLAEDVPRGVYAVRVATVSGVSHPLMLMVDDLPSVKEIASNHSLATAQTVLAPMAIDASGNGAESDYFVCEAPAGQWLTFEVVASRLGYSFDAILRVLDEQGREIAVVDDTPGLHGDCRLRLQATKLQRYFIEVYDSSYSNSARHKYRLRICVDPIGSATSAISERFQSIATALNVVESTGNTSAQVAEPVAAPKAVHGVFRESNEAYYYQLALNAGDRRRICGITRSEELPTDLLIMVYAPDGTLHASHDDAGLDEACFNLEAKQAGNYLLCVREINGRYGSEYGFRLEFSDSPQAFGLSAAAERVIIGQGGYGLLPVQSQRDGYDGPITLCIDDPSASFHLENAVIAAGQNQTLLKIVPSLELRPGDLRTIQITGHGEGAAGISPARVSLVDEVRALNPALTFPPTELWDQLAVSIAKPLPDFFGLRLATEEVLFPRIVGERYFTVYCVNRIEGFSEAIAVEAKNLPPGFKTSGNERPVGNSQNNEYRFQFNGPANVPLGEHRMAVQATGTFQGQTKEVLISNIPFRVIEPLIVSLQVSSLNLEMGEVALRVEAVRFLPRAGGDRNEIQLKWKECPDWLTSPESLSIGSGKNDTVVRMTISPSQDKSARLGQLVLIADTLVSGQPVQVESAPLEIRLPALSDPTEGRVK